MTETGAGSTEVATAPARFAGPLGALASRREAWVPGLDFVAPRKAVVKPDMTRRRLQLAGAGAGLVALVFAVSTALEFRDLSVKTEGLADEIRSMDELLAKGKPLVASHTAVEKWLAGQNEWLGEWRDLSRELPGTDRMFFESIRLEPAGGAKGTGAAMRLKGFARDREEVIKLTDAFVRNKDRYEISPHTARNTKDDAFYPWSVEVDIVSKPPKSAKGAGGNPVHRNRLRWSERTRRVDPSRSPQIRLPGTVTVRTRTAPMQPREKLLAIGLAATLGVWQGSRLLDSVVTRPLARAAPTSARCAKRCWRRKRNSPSKSGPPKPSPSGISAACHPTPQSRRACTRTGSSNWRRRGDCPNRS